MPFLLMLLVLLIRPAGLIGRPPVTRSRQLGLLVLAGLVLALPLVLTPNLVNAAIKMLIAALFALLVQPRHGPGGHAVLRPLRVLRPRRLRHPAPDEGASSTASSPGRRR